MNQRLICIILSLLIAGSGNAADRKKRVTANAGTGPYSFGPQTGLHSMSGFAVKAGPVFKAAGLLAAKLQKLIRSRKGQAFETTIQSTSSAAQIDPFFASPYSIFKSALENIHLFERFKVRLNLIFTAIIEKDFTTALQTLNSITDQIKEDIYYDERRPTLLSFNLGFFFHESSAYEFDNLILSTGEYGVIHNNSASYFTGGAYVPLTKGQAGATGRLGAGVFFGDPYRSVGSVNGAFYFSPFALDTAGTISTLIKPGNKPEVALTRTLVDHIRPGDVWLTFGLRQISRTTDRRVLANGTMGEAELTFALDHSYDGTYNASTLTLSGIYSANNHLGVDELGVDFRTPIATHTFFCGRYGTRGHYTVSLEMKL